jgi:hypothetical protein
MSLAKVIEEFVSDLEWKETVEIDQETRESSLVTRIEIRNQGFDLHVEGDESRERLSLFLYALFNMIEGKSMDACLLFNYINKCYSYIGRLCLGGTGRIRYREVIDIENLEPSAAMVLNMLASGGVLFERHIEQIAAVALTSRTYEAIRSEYEECDRMRKENPRE